MTATDLLIGPLLTTVAMAALFYLAKSQYDVYSPGPVSVLTLLVIYAVFRGGEASGLLTSALALMYLNYYFKITNGHGLGPTAVTARMLSWSVTLPVIVFIVGSLKRKAVRARTAELTTNVDFLRSILSTVGERIIVLDRDGKVVLTNPVLEKGVGGNIEAIPYEQRARAFGIYATDKVTALSTEELPSSRALRGETIENLELYVRNEHQPAGGFVLASANPIRDERGNITGAVSVSRDITEMKKMTEELKASRDDMESRVLARTHELEIVIANLGEAKNRVEDTQRKLREILKHVPFSFWSVGIDRRFTFREGFGLKSKGMSAEEIVGRTVDEIYADAPHALLAMERAFAGETFEVEAQSDDRWFNVALAPSFDEAGNVNGVSGITFDITERKQSEIEKTELEVRARTATEASKVKSEFLANMSHEIRTPLNGVIGMMGLLAETALAPEQRDYANSARSSAEALMCVINDILDFSKVEAGKLEFEDIDFDLHHLFREVATAFEFQVRAKGLMLNLDVAADVPRFVVGDPGRLRQVLNNLLSNALKFTARGAISIRARTADQPNLLRVEIEDSGIGIPRAALSRMFQAFSQADASTTRRFGGTGLGLSICKHLVEHMHGTIGVDSAENAGSTFWFSVELRGGQAQESKAVVAPPSADALAGRKLRVLVAEDNPVNQIIAIKVLEKMGLAVNAVANGHEVLDALRAIPYDLVLMDCQMPEMDGYEATRQIRATRSLPRNDIPIVAMTANAIQGDRERCLEAGMNDYIAKPVRTDELYAVLCRWLLATERKSA